MSPKQTKGGSIRKSGGNQTVEQVTLVQEDIRPIPSPEDLAAYAQISPDLANRIVAMAEKEQSHRHQQDNAQLEAGKAIAARGQYSALTVALVALAIAGLAFLRNHPTAGGFIGTVDLVVLVGVFLRGPTRRKRQLPPSNPAR